MVPCEEITRFINTYLNIARIPDASHNGVQVQGHARVSKIAFGVSASLELFRKAKSAGADMIIVHHGLLWGKEEPLVGLFRERVAFLLRHDITLLAYHLPLDLHGVIGHNAQLAKALGMQAVSPFGNYHGTDIGFKGTLAGIPLEQAVRTLEDFCGAKAAVLPYGPKEIRSAGIVSGGAYSLLPQAVEQKLDLYVTGVLDEPAQEWCREGHINCVALGHYNSEKPGIRALMDTVAKHFGVQTEFIDVANPI